MLWALTFFQQQRSYWALQFFALCGIAVLFTWPVWLPVTLAAFVGWLMTGTASPVRERVRAFLWGIAPISSMGILYALVYAASDHGVITHEGAVMTPSIEFYGRPLLGLVVLGMVISWRAMRARPLVWFAGAAVMQTALLWIGALNHWNAYYLVYKMFYLLLYPMVLFAALAMGWVWYLPERWLPPAVRKRWGTLALALPLVVLGMAQQRNLPSQPFSAITEPVYQVSLWAKTQLPSYCVDYLVNQWVTAYWLRVAVFGNPRAEVRTQALVNNFHSYRDALLPEEQTAGQPFLIVSDLNMLPFGTSFQILYQRGPAGVVRRLKGTCQEGVVPIDRLVIPPRSGRR